MNKILVLIVCMLLLLGPFAASAQEGEDLMRTGLRPDAPPYGVRGPYWVGTMELLIEDEERPLPVTLWYPAINTAGSAASHTYEFEYMPYIFVSVAGHALVDAETDTSTAPYPLVVHSHGNYSYRLASTFFNEHLASHGFVVIALDHTGNTSVNFRRVGFHPFHVHRPRDISRVIDFAEELTAVGGTLEGLIDVDHVGVTGWSFGGTTSLAVAGARMDMEAWGDWCDDNKPTFDLLGNCDIFFFQRLLADILDLEAIPDGLWPSLADDRVDAVVPFATDGRNFGSTGVADVSIPVLWMAEGQSIFFPIEPVQPIFASLASMHKSLVVFDDANHFIFANACDVIDQVDAYDMFPTCSDSVWDMDRAHDLINHIATAFLLAELYGDADAAAALLPENVSFPGVSYETTME